MSLLIEVSLALSGSLHEGSSLWWEALLSKSWSRGILGWLSEGGGSILGWLSKSSLVLNWLSESSLVLGWLLLRVMVVLVMMMLLVLVMLL